MKAAWALVFFAVCTLVVVSLLAIKQELNIRKMRKSINITADEVKAKEEEILSSKAVMQKLSNEMAPLDKQKIQLTKNMEELVKQKENNEKNLNTCQLQKTDTEQQKSEKTSAFNILRTNQITQIQTVQMEVQNLQKQILERDTKICLYVDEKREEARTLCKDKAAASNA